MKTGSVFFPGVKDSDSLLFLVCGSLRQKKKSFTNIHWHEPCRLLNNSGVFFSPSLTKSRRVVMRFQPLAGKIPPLSLALSLALLLTQLVHSGRGSRLPLVVTTWPFRTATETGRRTGRCHCPEGNNRK